MLFLTRNTLAILLFLFIATGNAGNYVRLNLPENLSMELPINWKVMSDNSRITLSSWVEAQLEKIDRQDIYNLTPFYAKYFDDNGKSTASVTVRYYPTLSTTESEALNGGNEFVKELNEYIKTDYKLGYEATGGKLVSWIGTKRNKINGTEFFISESRTITPDGNPWHNYLVRRFNSGKSFVVIIGYNEKIEFFLKPIVEKIIGSLEAH